MKIKFSLNEMKYAVILISVFTVAGFLIFAFLVPSHSPFTSGLYNSSLNYRIREIRTGMGAVSIKIKDNSWIHFRPVNESRVFTDIISKGDSLWKF